MLAARREGKLDRVAAACRLAAAAAGRNNPEVLAIATDVTDPAQCERLVARAAETFGRVDTLVNNAGLGMWEVGLWLKMILPRLVDDMAAKAISRGR